MSEVQKKSESAGRGQEWHPQLLKELPAATRATLQFAKLRLDSVRSKPSARVRGHLRRYFGKPSNLVFKEPKIEQRHLVIGADIFTMNIWTYLHK